MPRTSAVDSHPQREQIVKAILDGQSEVSIARTWNIGRKAVANYRHNRLNRAAIHERHELRDGKAIVSKLEELVEQLTKMAASLDLHLRDPDDPTKYTMDPWAGDIEVVYTEPVPDPNDANKTIKLKRRGNLQNLVDVIKHGVTAAYDFNLTIKRDDSRRIFIMTHQAIGEIIGQITKLFSIIAEAKTNVAKSEVFALFLQAIQRATKEHPEVLQAIAAEFETEGKGKGEAAPR
jgi:hypothetical protein